MKGAFRSKPTRRPRQRFGGVTLRAVLAEVGIWLRHPGRPPVQPHLAPFTPAFAIQRAEPWHVTGDAKGRKHT